MRYIFENPDVIVARTLEHLYMVVVALLLATLLALPVSLLLYRNRRLTTPVLGVLGILYTIPSIALLILLIPPFGLGRTTVIVALVIYAQILLVRNILAGLEGVPPFLLEAAAGMGMSSWQRWRRVQLPLAMPVIIAGVRLAAVVCVAIATIGAKFAAGGLGTLLFDGIAQNRYDKIVAGAIMVSLLALTLNYLPLAVERRYDPSYRIARAEKRRRA